MASCYRVEPYVLQPADAEADPVSTSPFMVIEMAK